MSKPNTMTLEDSIVQRIKGMDVFTLITDEDTLQQLTRRAIDEAVGVYRISKDAYGREISVLNDGPAVMAAKEIVKTAVTELAAEMMADLKKDPKFIQDVREFLAVDLLRALRGWMDHNVQSFVSVTESQTYNNILQRIRSVN